MQAELVGEAVGTRVDRAGALQHLRHGARRATRGHQRDLRFGRRRRSLDERDDLVDVGERDRLAFQNVGAFARLAQVVNRAARDDFAPMAHERLEHFLEVEQLRLAVLQARPC